MVRLSTVYDSELKEQVFKLRGDEDYARTTKTLLELGSPSVGSYGFDLPITVNVLRDRGNGTIVIYDNDVIVGTIDDWTSQDNQRSIQLEGLAFNIDHNIVAKYMGNNKCSPSSSKTETISVEDTHRYQATLSLQGNTSQFERGEYTNTIILSNPHSSSYNIGQTITVEYDGEIIQTLTTDDEGKKQFTIPDLGENGLHTLKFYYEGSVNLTSANLSKDISVGYQIEVIPPHNVLVSPNHFQLTAKVKDYLGELVTPDLGVTLYITDPSGNHIESVGTESQGVYSFDTTLTNDGTHSYYVYTAFNYEYTSSVNQFTYVIPSSITISSESPRLYKNEQDVITIDVNRTIEGIPVTLTGVISATRYTDANGKITQTITGTGVGTKSISAAVGQQSSSITLTDYNQYWEPPNTFVNRNYTIYPRTVLYDYQSYMDIQVPEGNGGNQLSDYGNLLLTVGNEALESYELVIEQLQSQEIGFVCVEGDSGQLTLYQLTANEAVDVKLSTDNGLLNLYIDGTVVSSVDYQSAWVNKPKITFLNPNRQAVHMRFTKLTLRGL